MTITTHLLDVDGTVIKELTGIADRGWTHPLRGAGAGSLTIRNDHPDFSALTHRRLIRCSLDGTPVFSWLLDRRTTQRLSQTGEAGKVTVWTGPGALAACGLSDLHAAVVVDDSGLKTIGWVTADHNDSGWTSPTDRGYGATLLPEDEDFPDPLAQWIGSPVGGDPTYLRRFLDTAVNVDVQGKTARLFVSGASAWTCWWDGVQIASGDAWQVAMVTVTLGSSGHQFALKVDSGPGLMSVITLDADGELTSASYRSFTPAIYGGSGNPDPWRAREAGAVPTDVTAGEAAAALIDAAQARSALAGISYTFTSTVDSDGQPWSVGLPIVAYRDGQQVGDILLQLTQQFGVDVQMGTDLELLLYDTLGTDLSGTVTLTDGTSAAAAATLTATGARANTVRIATSGGYGWNPGPSGVPAGESFRLETSASYGTAGSTDEVATASSELTIDLSGTVRQQVTSGGPTGARPYVDFGVGDLVGVRETDGGAYQPSQVLQITVLDLPGGEVEFSVDTERRP